ncbi:LPXTG-motif cell wall-anchored protein [Microbacterium sp. SORGH_AS 862]|nr:LPXTG-motif cell wall-anchored protein [Microbacterium sp. SORGH_AS_0862]
MSARLTAPSHRPRYALGWGRAEPDRRIARQASRCRRGAARGGRRPVTVGARGVFPRRSATAHALPLLRKQAGTDRCARRARFRPLRASARRDPVTVGDRGAGRDLGCAPRLRRRASGAFHPDDRPRPSRLSARRRRHRRRGHLAPPARGGETPTPGTGGETPTPGTGGEPSTPGTGTEQPIAAAPGAAPADRSDLALTGGEIASWALLAGGGLLLFGVALLIARRRAGARTDSWRQRRGASPIRRRPSSRSPGWFTPAR